MVAHVLILHVLFLSVVHTKNDKTAAVLVERRDPHPKYKKLVLNSSKYMVHDPESLCLR
jgi:small subunit ribosomal protein S17